MDDCLSHRSSTVEELKATGDLGDTVSHPMLHNFTPWLCHLEIMVPNGWLFITWVKYISGSSGNRRLTLWLCCLKKKSTVHWSHTVSQTISWAFGVKVQQWSLVPKGMRICIFTKRNRSLSVLYGFIRWVFHINRILKEDGGRVWAGFMWLGTGITCRV